MLSQDEIKSRIVEFLSKNNNFSVESVESVDVIAKSLFSAQSKISGSTVNKQNLFNWSKCLDIKLETEELDAKKLDEKYLIYLSKDVSRTIFSFYNEFFRPSEKILSMSYQRRKLHLTKMS